MDAANARVRPIVEYGPDPADSWVRRLTRDISERVQGFIGRVYPAEDQSTMFYGYADAGQDFAGMAGHVGASGTFRDGGHADISSGITEGPMGDPARRMFAARMRRGQVM